MPYINSRKSVTDADVSKTPKSLVSTYQPNTIPSVFAAALFCLNRLLQSQCISESEILLLPMKAASMELVHTIRERDIQKFSLSPNFYPLWARYDHINISSIQLGNKIREEQCPNEQIYCPEWRNVHLKNNCRVRTSFDANYEDVSSFWGLSLWLLRDWKLSWSSIFFDVLAHQLFSTQWLSAKKQSLLGSR